MFQFQTPFQESANIIYDSLFEALEASIQAVMLPFPLTIKCQFVCEII